MANETTDDDVPIIGREDIPEEASVLQDGTVFTEEETIGQLPPEEVTNHVGE